MTEQANARDLFRAAYEHRYTWDANFPGYSADIELKQGDEVYTGHVWIKPDMSVEVSGIEDEEVQQSVYTQMRDIVHPGREGQHRRCGYFSRRRLNGV
jgi:hypothetical protein